MSETWISRPELDDAIGRDAADKLCRTYGGLPLYVPRKPDAPHPRPPLLLQLLGSHAFAALCREYGGLHIVVPNGRRAEPSKPEIMRRLEEGRSPTQIALEFSVTERYVRRLSSEARVPVSFQFRLL